jgi:uncharacterized protein
VTDPAASKDVVRRYIEAINSGELDRVAEFYDDRTAWTIFGSDLPGAGTHIGSAAILGFLREVHQAFSEKPHLELVHVVAEGSWVVAEARGTGRFVNGSPYENNYALVFEVAGGKLRTIREYMDTHHVALRVAELAAAS